jgi:pyruvate dehydrogenase E2 component (dihydrolipoamide acetyltransferase)
MRTTIARRLVEASRTIPHFYLTADCTLEALMSLREAINAAAPKDKEGKLAYKISVNDFIVKALALALVPRPRRQCDLTRPHAENKHADIGVAVAIRRPYHAHRPHGRDQSLSVISSEMKDFSPRPRPQAEAGGISGGSTAVSNRHVREQ